MSKSEAELRTLFQTEIKKAYLDTFFRLHDEYPDIIENVTRLGPCAFEVSCYKLIYDHSSHPTDARSIYFDYYDLLNHYPAPTREELLTVVLDLDETLIHATQTGYEYSIYALNITNLIISLLGNITGIRLVLWTAGSDVHAINTLQLIDPQRKIKHVICRQMRADPNWHKSRADGYMGKKMIGLLKCENVIIFDNSSQISLPNRLKDYSDGLSDPCENIVKIKDFNTTILGPYEDQHTMLAILFYSMLLVDQIKTTSRSVAEILKFSYESDDTKQAIYLKKYSETPVPSFDIFETHTFDAQFLETMQQILENYATLHRVFKPGYDRLFEMAPSEAFSPSSLSSLSTSTSTVSLPMTLLRSLPSTRSLSPLASEPSSLTPSSSVCLRTSTPSSNILPATPIAGLKRPVLTSPSLPTVKSISTQLDSLSALRSRIRTSPFSAWSYFTEQWYQLQPDVSPAILFDDKAVGTPFYEELLELALKFFPAHQAPAKSARRCSLVCSI